MGPKGVTGAQGDGLEEPRVPKGMASKTILFGKGPRVRFSRRSNMVPMRASLKGDRKGDPVWLDVFVGQACARPSPKS